MNTFDTNSFFSLEAFEHKALFEETVFVWEALLRIKPYLASQKLGKIETDILPGVFLENPEAISIGKGTAIEPGVYIKGPCIIGKNCQLRQGAYIRGHVITGDGCIIGHATEAKHSIFLNKAHAAHFAYVGDSILGCEVNLGSGAVCSNLRFDGKEIVLHLDGKVLKTGLRKFGAIVGDRAQIGCNAVTNPGTLLGKEAFLYPCLNFGGFAESKTRIKQAQSVAIEKK